jgi:hypothetical protein
MILFGQKATPKPPPLAIERLFGGRGRHFYARWIFFGEVSDRQLAA